MCLWVGGNLHKECRQGAATQYPQILYNGWLWTPPAPHYFPAWIITLLLEWFSAVAHVLLWLLVYCQTTTAGIKKCASSSPCNKHPIVSLVIDRIHRATYTARHFISGALTKFRLLASSYVSVRMIQLYSLFYIHGSVLGESNLITVQQDATYSVYYISIGSSTCFGCWHPSSGARTTVITASGID